MSNLTKPYVYETNTYNVTDAKANCTKLMDAIEQNKVSLTKIANTVDEISQNIDTKGYTTSWADFGNILDGFINEYTTSSATKLNGLYSKEAIDINVFRANTGNVWLHQIRDSKFGVNSYEVPSSVLTNRTSANATTGDFTVAATKNTGIVTLTAATAAKLNKVHAVDTSGANVDYTDNEITISTHGLNTGDSVSYTSTAAVTGLTTATTYFVIYVDENTISLATSAANATAGTKIDLTTGAGHASDTFTLNHVVGDVISITGLSDATAKTLLYESDGTTSKKFKIQAITATVITIHIGTATHAAISGSANSSLLINSYGAGTVTTTSSQSKKVSVKDNTGKVFTAFYLPGMNLFLDDYKTLEVQTLEKNNRLDVDTLDNPPLVSITDFRIAPRRLDSNDAFEELPGTETLFETHLDKMLNANLTNQTTFNDADDKSCHADRASLVNKLDQIITVIKSVLLSPNLNM